jgi:dTDP-4-dehydrorhamnose 3,5-epimerase
MIFTKTELSGVFIIDLERKVDERGFFARAWCQEEFEAHGLNTNLVQMNVGFSARKGTVRGLHFQRSPWAETKLVRCTLGAIFDVVVDLRPGSPTHRKWLAIALTQENRRMLYSPEGFAHGYQALSDDAEMYYQTTRFYAGDYATGIRYDDPAFGIVWPTEVTVISPNDRSWPDYKS